MTTKFERSDNTEWMQLAACRGDDIDPELFWARESEHDKVEQARAVCNRCPVRTPCLLAAYADRNESISAGLTPRQRTLFLRKAGNNVARAVAEALTDPVVLLRQVYSHHAKPDGHGHVVWTDRRYCITVRGEAHSVHQLAWIALHGARPVGSVVRVCDVDGCVAKGCLTDRKAREQAAQAAVDHRKDTTP